MPDNSYGYAPFMRVNLLAGPFACVGLAALLAAHHPWRSAVLLGVAATLLMIRTLAAPSFHSTVAAALLVLAFQWGVIAMTGGMLSPLAPAVLVVVALSAVSLRRHDSRTVMLAASVSLWSWLLLAWVVTPELLQTTPFRVGVSWPWMVTFTCVVQVVALALWRLVALQASEIRAASRRQAELAQARQRDLEAISASIAHDMRNPLTAIQTLATSLRHTADGENSEAFDVMVAQTHRIRDAVDDFLVVFRPLEPIALRPVPVLAAIEAATDACSGRAEASGVAMRVQGVEPHLVIRANPSKLDRLLCNLLLNAIEASERGAVVEISASRAADGCELRIEDTGTGVDPSVVTQLFSAGFTTKSNGQGLGLFGARRIAEEHGGTVSLHERQTAGTIARVWLPALEVAA